MITQEFYEAHKTAFTFGFLIVEGLSPSPVLLSLGIGLGKKKETISVTGVILGSIALLLSSAAAKLSGWPTTWTVWWPYLIWVPIPLALLGVALNLHKKAPNQMPEPIPASRDGSP